jgi:dihydroxy-acid dehydratase
VRDGDKISINAAQKTIDWLVEEDEQARRREAWEKSGKSALNVKRGILLRYARDVAVRLGGPYWRVVWRTEDLPQSADVGAYCD